MSYSFIKLLYYDLRQNSFTFIQTVISSQKRNVHEAKVLVLGSSDAGKSTLCRHMSQLYGEQFTESEILRFKGKVRSACLKHFVSILHDFLKEDYVRPSLQHLCERFLEEWKRGSLMERSFLDSGVAIWRVSSFHEYIQQRIKITNQLNNTSCDSGKLTFKQKQLHSDNPAKHCLIYFDRIMNKGYQPNLDDILNLKDPTIGTL